VLQEDAVVVVVVGLCTWIAALILAAAADSDSRDRKFLDDNLEFYLHKCEITEE
jgi:hypothetical protein